MKTLIEVTETRAISADSGQWMLMKRSKKTDKKTGEAVGGYSDWASYAYLSTFGKAAETLEDELIRTSGAQTFTELSRLAKQIHGQLQQVFTQAEGYR